jgi:hypothetical protein
MAACIYCGDPADSGEHWLPRTLGTFKHLDQLRDRLCQRCNKVLGDELDQEIANTGTTGLAKFALGIEGRHKAPSKNPFQYKVMGTEAATTMLMDSPDGSCKILGQFFRTESGEARATALRQLVFTKSDGAVVPVQFPRGYSSERLRELVKARGVDGATLTAIYIDPDESHEDGALLALIKDALGSFNATVYGGVGESAGRKDILVSSNISLAYMRGIAKLAFRRPVTDKDLAAPLAFFSRCLALRTFKKSKITT